MSNDPNRTNMTNAPSSSSTMSKNSYGAFQPNAMSNGVAVYQSQMSGGGSAGFDMAMSNLSIQQQQQPNMQYCASNSKEWINLNAVEFIPRNFYSQNYQSQQQHYHQGYPNEQGWFAQEPPTHNSQYDAHASAHQQSNQNAWMMNTGEINESHLEPAVTYSDPNIIQAMQNDPNMFMEIQVGIEQLILNNDDSEIWRQAIVQKLTTPRTVAISQLEVVAKMIFETAAQHPDHLYTLAVLFAYMVNHPMLAENLLMRCILPLSRTEHEKREITLKNDPERARRFASFLSELYLRLMTRMRMRLGPLKLAVFQQLDTLMRDPKNDANVMCAMRILKNTGRALYEDDPDQLDNIVEHIGQLSKNPPIELAELTKTNLISIVKLHDNRWGLPQPAAVNKSESSTSSVASPTAQPKNPESHSSAVKVTPSSDTAQVHYVDDDDEALFDICAAGLSERPDSLTEDERRIEEYLTETMKLDDDEQESKSADDEDAALEEFLARKINDENNSSEPQL